MTSKKGGVMTVNNDFFKGSREWGLTVYTKAEGKNDDFVASALKSRDGFTITTTKDISLRDLNITKSTEERFKDCHLIVKTPHNAYIVNADDEVVGGIVSAPDKKLMVMSPQNETDLFFKKVNAFK